MKSHLPILFLPFTVLLALSGCSSTNPDANAPYVSGKTGTMTTINGIDVWQDEKPSEPYTVLRTIQDRRKALSPTNSILQSLAQQARTSGGNAVIILSMKNDTTGGQLASQVPSATNATDNSSTLTTAQVIIYKNKGSRPPEVRTSQPGADLPPPPPTPMAPNGSL